MVLSVTGELASVLGVIFVHNAVEHVVKDRRALKAALSHSLVYRARRLRVSMAQILSIKVDERFLLIENAKRPERLTPIGGVVRYFPSEIPQLEGDLGFVHELKKHGERFDLRGYLLGKNLVSFLKWYASGVGREQWALAREIEEEFNEIGIPAIGGFVRRPEFIRERTIHEGPCRITSRDYWQYRYFEVLSLREESAVSQSLAQFIRTSARANPRLVLVSTEEIRRGRSTNGKLIGDSAGYLFSESRIGTDASPLI